MCLASILFLFINVVANLHFESFIPHGVERLLDGSCLLLVAVPRVRYQLDLDIGITQAVGIHRDQITCLYHCKYTLLWDIFHKRNGYSKYRTEDDTQNQQTTQPSQSINFQLLTPLRFCLTPSTLFSLSLTCY